MREGLGSAAAYEREIRLLAERRRAPTARSPHEPSGPLIALHAERIARMLADEVRTGRYAFAPLTPHAAWLGGKRRTLYRCGALDAVVHGVLARVLGAAIEPQLGDHLHSYRAGRSQWSACRALGRHLREHARAHPDPRTRGVFVLRRDVRGYGESIPVGDDSALWSTFDRLLAGNRLGLDAELPAFLRRALRPEVAGLEGSAARALAIGVPTGLPTQPVACNVYLLPLDAQLLELGGFYARFGDDILFAHRELAVAEEAARRLDQGAAALGLELNPTKSHAYWLTAPGRAHPDAPGFEPVARLPYLGFDVGFGGARLRNDKRRGLIAALRARLAHTDRLLIGLPPAERASALCRVVATAFDPSSPLCDRYASWLRADVIALGELKQLDHQLALTVAERLSGRRGPRAFRAYPPRALYEEHGLPSLLRAYVRARGVTP